MERASDNSEELPPETEVSREEKVHFTRPERAQDDRTVAKSDRSLSRNQLINKLNHINFQNGTITAVFKHHKYPRTLSFEVKSRSSLEQAGGVLLVVICRGNGVGPLPV